MTDLSIQDINDRLEEFSSLAVINNHLQDVRAEKEMLKKQDNVTERWKIDMKSLEEEEEFFLNEKKRIQRLKEIDSVVAAKRLVDDGNELFNRLHCEKEILLEQRRADMVVKSFKEDGIPFKREDMVCDECPICNKDVFPGEKRHTFMCCGGMFCLECIEKWKGNCPTCKSPLPRNKMTAFENLKKKAKQGCKHTGC